MPTDSVLFRLTTKHFVKTIGGPDFLPVPNVHAGHMLSPLSIVVKRPANKWFRRNRYEYTVRETKITSLLEDTSDLDLEMTEIPDHIINCRSSNCTSLKAGSGINILKTFFARWKIVKYKCHSFTSGRTKAKGVEKRHLMEALKNRKINLNDPEIRQMLKACKDSVLCVVVSVIRTTERVDITEETKMEVEGDLGIDIPDGKGILSLGRAQNNSPELSITPTVLAYEVCELEVDLETGKITVLIEPGLSGGFITGYSTIDAMVSMRSPSETYMCSLYRTLEEMTPEERNIVRDVVLTSADDVDIICQILYQRTNYPDNYETSFQKDLRASIEDMKKSSHSLRHTGSSDEDDDSLSFSTTSSGYSSELPSPSNDDVTLLTQETITTTSDIISRPQSSTDIPVLSLTTKPLVFQRLLQVIGWNIMSDGSMVPPDDKHRMDLLECFFVLLKRVHQDTPDVVDNIASLSSRSRNNLWEKYRHELVTWDEDKIEERNVEQVEMDNAKEECTKMEQLLKYLEESSYTKYAIFSMLLALS